jgi:1-acyl-sn-glycerol-3-phosphate acyltransferase
MLETDEHTTAPTAEPPRPNAFGDLSKGTLRGFAFKGVRAVLLFLCRIFLGMRIQGLENVPASGGLLVVANHLHNADPVLISIAFPRPLHFMAKKELFGVPVIGWVISRVGSFPVDRGRADRTAIRRAQATLDQGIALGIFPEGTRSRTGRIERVHTGVGMLALRGNAPILPIAITGSERLPGSGSKKRRKEAKDGMEPAPPYLGVRIVVGEAFTLPRGDNGRRLSTDEATDVVMRRVAALLPAPYRGIYGEPAPEPLPRTDSASISSSAGSSVSTTSSSDS